MLPFLNKILEYCMESLYTYVYKTDIRGKQMRNRKKILAFCLALLFGILPVQYAYAAERAETTGAAADTLVKKTDKKQEIEEKTEEQNQKASDIETEKKLQNEEAEAAFCPDLLKLEEAAALLEKRYTTEEQTVETMFLKYFVQRVYAYAAHAEEALVQYQQAVLQNPLTKKSPEIQEMVSLLVLEEKEVLAEQLNAFRQLKLVKEKKIQEAVVGLETALTELNAETLLSEAKAQVYEQMQYINLPVALHVQQTTYTCGMASSKMILDYLQITDKMGSLYQESTLWDWADSNGQGTYVYRVAQTLTHFGAAYQFQYMEGAENKSDFYWEEIKASLEKNKPVIAQVRPLKNEYWEYSSGHYILVKGMYVDKEGVRQVIINDCHYKYSAQDKVIPLDELIKSNENHSSYMVFGK